MSSPGHPETDVNVNDVVAFLVEIAALVLLASVILRLGLHRWRDARRGLVDSRSHPFTYLAYALALLMLAVQCIDPDGPPHWVLYSLVVAVLVFGFLGINTRVKFSLRPPWRR